MTAKEKAKELVDKMARIDGYQDSIDLSTCYDEKEYALIAVDELIECSKSYDSYNATWASQVSYWEEVKSEINKIFIKDNE